jgi:hypothetical protein
MANPDIPERWYQPDTNAEHVVTSEPGVRVLRALRRKSRDCGTTVHRRPQFVRTWLTVVVVIIAAMTGVSISVSVPTVRADDQQYEAFCTPPDPLPAGMPGESYVLTLPAGSGTLRAAGLVCWNRDPNHVSQHRRSR